MRMIKASALLSWSHLKESRRLDPTEYVDITSQEGVPPPYRLVFVSHRWITGKHPDPDGTQFAELQRRLNDLPVQDSPQAPLLVFFDFASLPQRPRNAEEETSFYRDLASLESLSRLADYFIILSEGYRDYLNRAWCFFEAITARDNVHLFADQEQIRQDLAWREYLMVEDIQQITSYDLGYKLDASETEIIVAAFQHLHACRVTQSEDAALIKEQLITHYNKRRLTSFGKLVVGIHKFFEVEFGMMPVGGMGEVFVGIPFLEQPDWVRLPCLETHARIMGGRPGPSLFALPPETMEDIVQRYKRGFQPLLRLTFPGILNVEPLIKEFQSSPDWQDYVVNPTMISEQVDPFPTIEHVIHTVLERPPGFFHSRDGRYLYFFLTGD